MKCLCLEQWLPSPVCAKRARTEHLHQLHTNQLLVKALIQIHPTRFSDAEGPMNTLVHALNCPMHPLGCSSCFGGNWGVESTPNECLELHETLKVFDHTHQTNKCTWSKTVSQLFHFQLPWDFSDSSDFSPSALFISFQWNTHWQLLVG